MGLPEIWGDGDSLNFFSIGWPDSDRSSAGRTLISGLRLGSGSESGAGRLQRFFGTSLTSLDGGFVTNEIGSDDAMGASDELSGVNLFFGRSGDLTDAGCADGSAL